MTKKLNTPTGKYALLLLACFFLIKNAHAQSVTINQNPSGTICGGTPVEFTAVPSGFSGQVYYQWFLNGTAIDNATSSKYTTSTLTNNDQIFVACNTSPIGSMVTGSELYYDASNPYSYSGSGTSVKDLSGKTRDGTLLGTAGGYNTTNGGVFSFNGTNQNISTGWKPSTTFSLQMAFYNNYSYSNDWNRGILTTYDQNAVPLTVANCCYGIYIGTQLTSNSSAGLHFFYDNNASGNIGTTSTFSVNQWYILTVISDPSANSNQGSIKFYLDGGNTEIAAITGKTSHVGNLFIGRSGWNGPNGDWWKGYIANTIVYNRVLTGAEITKNFNSITSRLTNKNSNVITADVSPYVSITVAGDGCVNKTVLSANATFNSYEWSLNGSVIQDANAQNYSPTTAGNYRVKVFNGSCYGTSVITTINVCGITATGKMSTSTSLINKLGGAASTTVKGMDERGSGINLPN